MFCFTALDSSTIIFVVMPLPPVVCVCVYAHICAYYVSPKEKSVTQQYLTVKSNSKALLKHSCIETIDLACGTKPDLQDSQWSSLKWPESQMVKFYGDRR